MTTAFDPFAPGPGSENASLPSVDPADLKSIWAMQNGFEPSAPGQHMAVSINLYKRACNPGADVFSVFARAALLRVLPMAGTLGPWTHQGSHRHEPTHDRDGPRLASNSNSPLRGCFSP